MPWATQQLAEFLAAVSSAETEADVARAAVERAAEALDAEVAALIGSDRVLAAVGYPEGALPVQELMSARGTDATLDVPGSGRCPATAASLEHPAGAMLVVGRCAPQGLDAREAGLLRGMARVTSMALRMQRLLEDERAGHERTERLAREQAALRRIATLVAQQAPAQEILTAVAEESARLLGADSGNVSKFIDGSVPARQLLVAGWSLHGTHFPVGTEIELIGNSLAGLVRATGEAARFDSTEGYTGPAIEIAGKLGITCAVAVPVFVERKLWGVLAVSSNQSAPLAADTEPRLARLSVLTATAISNTEARGELHRVAEEQAALRRVATRVARGASPEHVFETVAHELSRILGTDIASMGAVHPDGTVTFVAQSGQPPWPGCARPDPFSAIGQVLATGRPARLDDYSKVSTEIGDLLRSVGVTSGVASPIMVEGRLWGVTYVGSRRGPLPADTEQRMVDFTELVATAIANAQARVELRRVADEQAALRRVATLVARGASPSATFAAVADEVDQLIGADVTAIRRFDPDGTAMLLALTGGGGRLGSSIKIEPPSAIEKVFHTSRTARVDRYEDTAQRRLEVDGRYGTSSTVAGPIIVSGRLWGVITVSTREAALPPDTDQRLVDFTELVAAAIANAENHAALASSRARLVTAGDAARRRIERDLHDGIQQRLVSLALEMRNLIDDVAGERPPVGARLAGVLDEIKEVLDGLRELSRGIHPAILTAGGLLPALKSLARRSPIPVELDLAPLGRLPQPVEVAAYFAASEVLTNAAKHSGASVVKMNLSADPGTLRLSISDDGNGGADTAAGSGLLGLADRADALGGRFTIQSPAGGGTTVVLELPLEAPPELPSPPQDSTDAGRLVQARERQPHPVGHRHARVPETDGDGKGR